MNEREIFQGAIDHSDLAQRQAFLDQACEGDPALRARIEALLASHAAASQFLNVPALEQLQAPATAPRQTIDFARANAENDHERTGRNDGDDPGNGPSAAPDLAFLQPSSKPGSIGTLGCYEILQVIGQGAFGIVFKAFDEKLQRTVAIKAMNPRLAATSPPRKRFLREGRSVAAIKHENIVQVYTVEEQPSPYLVMEYIDGQTLQQRLDATGPLEVAEILHLGRQMALGLAAAHARGLIHRDIKPGNILLEQGADAKVKITDFGLARAADDASMTRTGVIAGTPLFMAPEQAQGLPLDHRADLFSLGSVLYQMACGRPPFRAATAIAVLKRVAEESPRPIQEIISEVPGWLCTIISKLHTKKPEERFQSAKEVADLLGRCLSELQQHGKVDEIVLTSLKKRPERRDQHASDVKTGVESIRSSTHGNPPTSPAAMAPITSNRPRRAERFFFAIAGTIASLTLFTVILGTISWTSAGVALLFSGWMFAVGLSARGQEEIDHARHAGAWPKAGETPTLDHVHRLASMGNTSLAVKLYSQLKTVGVSEAKAYVDQLAKAPATAVPLTGEIGVQSAITRASGASERPQTMAIILAPLRRWKFLLLFFPLLTAVWFFSKSAINLVPRPQAGEHQSKQAATAGYTIVPQGDGAVRVTPDQRVWRKWDWGTEGPTFNEDFARNALKLDDSQLAEVNCVIQTIHREYLALETSHSRQHRDSKGRLTTTIDGLDVSPLEDRLWSQLDPILRSEERQRIARLNCKFHPRYRDTMAGVSTDDLVKAGLFGWEDDGAQIEVWRVGDWFYWKVEPHSTRLNSEQHARQLPQEYQRFWNDPEVEKTRRSIRADN